MFLLTLGLVLFLGIHSVGMVAPGLRAALVARIGSGPWQGLYSLISGVGLVLIVWGFGVARVTALSLLFVPPTPARHLALLLTLPAMILGIAAYLPGRISAAIRHPMLTGVILWAAAHLLANGMRHEVALFGAFLVWAVADRLSFLVRTQRPIPMAPPSPANDLVAVAAGTATWGLLLVGGHRWLFGVAPLPSLTLF